MGDSSRLVINYENKICNNYLLDFIDYDSELRTGQKEN